MESHCWLAHTDVYTSELDILGLGLGSWHYHLEHYYYYYYLTFNLFWQANSSKWESILQMCACCAWSSKASVVFLFLFRVSVAIGLTLVLANPSSGLFYQVMSGACRIRQHTELQTRKNCVWNSKELNPAHVILFLLF